MALYATLPRAFVQCSFCCVNANTQSRRVTIPQAVQPITRGSWEVNYAESLLAEEGQLHLVCTSIHRLILDMDLLSLHAVSDQTLTHPLPSLEIVYTILLLTKEPNLQPLTV